MAGWRFELKSGFSLMPDGFEQDAGFGGGELGVAVGSAGCGARQAEGEECGFHGWVEGMRGEGPMTAVARKGGGAIHSKSLADWIIDRLTQYSLISRVNRF